MGVQHLIKLDSGLQAFEYGHLCAPILLAATIKHMYVIHSLSIKRGVKIMVFSAGLRRELLQLLTDVEGHSRAAAKAVIDGLTKEGCMTYLVHLRQRALLASAEAAPVTTVSSVVPVRARKVPYTLLLQPEQLDALKSVSERDGSPVSHHIRQAIRAYLKAYRI